jgi:hypothetical protein
MKLHIHTIIRSIAMTASVIMVPNTAILCRTLSIQVSKGYSHWGLAQEPLPAITRFWIIGQSQSSMVIIIALVLAAALALALAGFKVSRLPETSPWKATGQILVTILGPIFALLMMSSTIMAAIMPAMVVFQSVPK